MAEYKRQNVRRTAGRYEGRNLYIVEGNTARQFENQEYYIPEERRGEEIRRARRTRERALQISPAFVLFLALVSVFMLGTCVSYMKVQASIHTRMANIETLEGTLAELKDLNEATSSRIAVASDIHQIYKTATEELGMVYPDDSQVIYYDRTESEYVQQYEDIPRE